MTEKHFKFLCDPGEYVTWRLILFFQCILVIYVNFNYILLAKRHAAVHVCILWLSERQMFVSFH